MSYLCIGFEEDGGLPLTHNLISKITHDTDTTIFSE